MTTAEGPYFRVEQRATRNIGGVRWKARATIVRTDIDEPVEVVVAKAPTAQAADEQLDAAIERALAQLEKPNDWGRDPTVPRLVRRYLRFRDDLYGLVLQRDPGARAYDERERANLRACVEALTEAQLVELATPTEEQLAHIDDDSDVMDLVTAKKRLIALIDHISPAVRAGYEQIERALNRGE